MTTKLHWSERHRLEQMTEAEERPDQKQIIEAASVTEAIDLIVKLVEHQRWRFAQAALRDKSKCPQRLEGHATAFDALLDFDLYPIQEELKARRR
jgi:hypothetical protein